MVNCRVIVECTCVFCQTKFYRNPKRLLRSKLGIAYCSRRCKESVIQSKLTFQEPIAVFKTTYNKKYYRALALAHYGPQCNRCGFDDHVTALEVHHCDRDRDNNYIDNLEVLCKICHRREHKDGI